MNNGNCFALMHHWRVLAIFTSFKSVCKQKKCLAPIFTAMYNGNDTISSGGSRSMFSLGYNSKLLNKMCASMFAQAEMIKFPPASSGTLFLR